MTMPTGERTGTQNETSAPKVKENANERTWLEKAVPEMEIVDMLEMARDAKAIDKEVQQRVEGGEKASDALISIVKARVRVRRKAGSEGSKANQGVD